ncbi:MAG: proteasome subunit alpha [Nitrospinales bacterium]
MQDEPFRWMEAIATRHSYVQEKIKNGQPVIGVPYKDGSLLLGFAPQPGKIFEIYDRIALGALGHPADVEKLRMTLLDTAHLEGFNRSDKDVTLARILQFGIAPGMKQNFEEIARAPYLVQLLMTELDFNGHPHFFRMNYDGHWEILKKGGAIAGDPELMEWIQNKIEATSFADLPLEKALVESCKLWEECKKHFADNEEDSEKIEGPISLKEAFDKWVLEAAVLTNSTSKKSLYRAISIDETEALKTELNLK